MANVSFGTGAAYATDILLAQNMFYKSNFGWGTIYYLSGVPNVLGLLSEVFEKICC